MHNIGKGVEAAGNGCHVIRIKLKLQVLEYADLRGFTSELTKDDSSQYIIIYIYICLPTRKNT